MSEATSILSIVDSVLKIVKIPIQYYAEYKRTKDDIFILNSVSKSVTIYKNGHGIMINDNDIHVRDSAQFKQFKRKIDVSDGKNTVKFPKLSTILNTKKQDRFSEYGLWGYSKDNIIQEIVEKNWDDNKTTKKQLKWIFNIDQSKIEDNKSYNLGYVLSIPGMFKIDNGYAEKPKNRKKNKSQEMSSTITVGHKAKIVNFEIAFEDGIALEAVPCCEIYDGIDSEKGKVIPLNSHAYNALYNKYNFVVKKPKIGNIIKVSWVVSAQNSDTK